MRTIHYLFFLLIFISCENSIEEINRVIRESELTYEVAHDVEMLYSDSAIVKIRITGPTLHNHLDGRNPRKEFPNGISVEFLNENGRVTSYLTAGYAMIYEKKDEVYVRDSVVLQTLDGETLETEELNWDERRKKLNTTKFVTIQTAKEKFYGFGLEANEDFSWWKIVKPMGSMEVEQLNILD